MAPTSIKGLNPKGAAIVPRLSLRSAPLALGGRPEVNSNLMEAQGIKEKLDGEPKFMRTQGVKEKLDGDARFMGTQGVNEKLDGEAKFMGAQGVNEKLDGDSRFMGTQGVNEKLDGDPRCQRKRIAKSPPTTSTPMAPWRSHHQPPSPRRRDLAQKNSLPTDGPIRFYRKKSIWIYRIKHPSFFQGNSRASLPKTHGRPKVSTKKNCGQITQTRSNQQHYATATVMRALYGRLSCGRLLYGRYTGMVQPSRAANAAAQVFSDRLLTSRPACPGLFPPGFPGKSRFFHPRHPNQPKPDAPHPFPAP
jgi:hypothetical protein